MAANVSDGSRLRVRVMLRNARFEFTPAHCEFMCALLPKLDVQDAAGRDCLAFALELLAELGGSADVYAALAARKKWLSKALHHSQRMREHLSQSNVETLLSQGLRLTWVDEAQARHQMTAIDRICVAAFGRSVPVDADGWREAVDIDGLPNVADWMRRLT